MEAKKSKRGRPKSVGGQPSRKKSRNMDASADLTDASDQEMREKIEAANVLSSLKFMAPQSKEASASAPVAHAAENAGKIPLTHKTLEKRRGNSARRTEAPPVKETPVKTNKPIVVHTPLTKAPKTPVPSSQGVVLSEQANKFILMQLYNSLRTRQTKPESEITSTSNSSTSSLPSDSIIPSSEASQKGKEFADKPTSALPNILQPFNPVNSAVVAALKSAISVHSPPKQSGSRSDFNTRHTASQQQNHERATDSPDSDKKTENQETSLPLKKRRILASEENTRLAAAKSSSPSASEINEESDSDMKNILRLAQSTQMTSMISEIPTLKPGDGYKPIDPSASLRVLSDVKQALTPDEDGDLPIHIAVVHKNNALVKRFVEIMTMSGKSVDRYNKLMQVFPIIATIRWFPALQKTILEIQTPLHLAVLVDEPKIIKTLLMSLANPNLVDRNGCTAMHLAVQKGFNYCLLTILDHSRYHCNLDTRNYEGYTPLHTTVENNDKSAMVTLLTNGANIDSQDGKAGRSVLYYAVEYRRYDMCHYLHQHEANLDLPNYAGITAAMAAQSTNQERILDIIGKPFEGSRHLDGTSIPHATRKLPLPRIPSKASLIGPDEKPFSMSRTNSIEDIKPYPTRRPSFSSPVDLSLKDPVKTEDIKPYIKTENPSFSASNSILKSTLTAGQTNKPAKLVEKHAVLVEQLQRQNKTPTDEGPYVYLSKEKYKALLELSMQRYRASQSLKAAAGWTKARALSVDETRPKDSPILENTLKSDLILTSISSLTGKAQKPSLSAHENELLERIKSAKSKERKEGQALLSLVLDNDLRRNISKLVEVPESSVSLEKQQVSSMKLRTILSQAVDGGEKSALQGKESESLNDMSSPTRQDKLDHEKATTEKDKKHVFVRNSSGDNLQGVVENTNSDSLKSEGDNNIKSDSENLKLSQGFDTQNIEETLRKGTRGESENLVKSHSEHKKEEKLATQKSAFNESSDIASSKEDASGVNKKINMAEITALHQEEDSSSVEVPGNLSIEEDDVEDGALVIDEKAGENKSLKSNAEEDTNSDIAKSNDAMTVSDDKAEATQSDSIRDTVPIRSLNNPSESLSSIGKDKHASSESETGNTVGSSQVEASSDNVKDESPRNPAEGSGHIKDNGKGLATENTVKENNQTDQCSNVKEKMNSDKNLNECEVHERTDWETESIATCEPPPLTKFEQSSQAKKIEESETCNSSPPVLSKFGFSSDQSDSHENKETIKSGSLDSVSREKFELDNAENLDKSSKEIASITNKDSKTQDSGSQSNSESDYGKTKESEEVGKTVRVARQEVEKYLNDSGFQFYLRERGVRIGEGVDLEQHYLAYKNVEDRILRDAGIIPIVKKAKDSNSLTKNILDDRLKDSVNDNKVINRDPLLKDISNENDKNISLNSADLMRLFGPSTGSTVEQEEDQSDDETLTLQTDFKTINVSKAHTLYFFDGQNYRAVKVYVDDTEASSEQFKKMFSQSLNKGLGNASVVLSSHNGPTEVSSAAVNSVPERVCETLPEKGDNRVVPEIAKGDNIVNSQRGNEVNEVPPERAKDDNLVSYGPSRDKPNVSLTKKSKSASFDSGRMHQSLKNKLNRQGTNIDQSASYSKLNDNRSIMEYVNFLRKRQAGQETVHPNTSDMNLASVVDNSRPQKTSRVTNEVQDLSKKSAKLVSSPIMSHILSQKQTVTQSVMVPRTSSHTSVLMTTSEGTLTRVNPDIKNRLSKALQSPARKLNITKSDSSDRLLIPVTRTDSSDRLVPVTCSSGTSVSVTREGNLRLQM